MMATCPVVSGVVNAGASPPELTVSTALLSSPELSIMKDCRAPGVFSFVALRMFSDGSTEREECTY